MRTYRECYHWIVGMECSQLSFAFAYTNLNGNDFHRNCGSHATSFHFRPQGLDFKVRSCMSVCFRSLAKFLLAFDDRIQAGWFSFALQVILDQS
jgi:hypothetical protein